MNPNYIDFRKVKPGIFDNNYHFIADMFLRASITMDYYRISETEVNWGNVKQLKEWVDRNDLGSLEQLQSYDEIVINTLSYLFGQKDNPVTAIGNLGYKMRNFSIKLRDAENLSKDNLTDLMNFCFDAHKTFRIMGDVYQPY
ncbi:MAG: hypothetical protein ABIF40_05150 [archaeon]